MGIFIETFRQRLLKQINDPEPGPTDLRRRYFALKPSIQRQGPEDEFRLDTTRCPNEEKFQTTFMGTLASKCIAKGEALKASEGLIQ
jgi:hypothetical protein